MAEKSGFFPSTVDNPRKYGNVDMNMPYKKLVRNGVFATPQGTPSTELQIMADTGLNITMKQGNGIFNDFWYENTNDKSLTILTGSAVNRTDYVVIRSDKNESTKRNYVLVKTGNTTTGAAPELLDTAYIKEYLLAKIVVPALATTIDQSMIEDCRGTADCPWITSLINQVDTSTLWIQFNTAFNTWFENLRDNLTTTVMLTQKTAQYITVSANQTVITIPTSLSFNINLDILNVYIEGRKLIQDVDYTKEATQITLTLGLLDIGTKVEFEVIKNIDATDVEEYVERLYALETIVDDTKATANNGAVKLAVTTDLLTELLNLGVGLHTFYSGNNKTNNPKGNTVWRGICHLTGPMLGWVLAFSNEGDVFANYVNGVEWVGWRNVYEANTTQLWTGSVLMNSGTTIRPTKALSKCRNGWQLTWGEFTSGAFVDSKYVTTFIPKVKPNGALWGGQLTYHAIPYNVTASTDSICVKGLMTSDGQLTGTSTNDSGTRNNVVLRSVCEY